VRIRFYVIYTSMDKMISMEAWLKTAIGYYTECNVEILDVEQDGRGKSFWSDVYEEMKGYQEKYV
jgi:hypothetical protein